MNGYGLLRSALFGLSPHRSHRLALDALALAERHEMARAFLAFLAGPADPRLRRRVMGLDFPSPIGLAGGFDKNAEAPRTLAALGFGFLELGTVTAQAQEANPEPNLFRLPDDRALVNRLGFPNEGAAAVTQRFAAGPRPPVPVGFSIGKSRAVALDPVSLAIADYRASFAAVHLHADFVVVNVSSPNTAGLRALQTADVARSLFEALQEDNQRLGAKPLLVKVAPDLEDGEYAALLEEVKRFELAGVVATNTTVARRDLRTPAARIEEIGAGGLSGPPVNARARAMVTMARAALGAKAAVIGVGGIETASDVRAMLHAGADLVQVYTGFVYGGPFLPSALARDLAL
jgi:dihydroorotate dehydrogenase